MRKFTVRRPPVTATIRAGHFGGVAKGWPFEGLYDEGQTSSALGQDIYRLNEGPVNLINRESSSEGDNGLTIVSLEDLSIDPHEGDEADQWLKLHGGK